MRNTRQPHAGNGGRMTRMPNHRFASCLLASLLVLPLAAAAGTLPAAPAGVQTVEVAVDAQAKGTAFPHFWEQMFGSGHAVLALRDGYRNDLEMVKQATGFTYVRAHGILDREVGVFELDQQ